MQRLSESHKLITDEKYDVKNRLTQANRKIAQLEHAVLNNVEAKTYANGENEDEGLIKSLMALIESLAKNNEAANVLQEVSNVKGYLR